MNAKEKTVAHDGTSAKSALVSDGRSDATSRRRLAGDHPDVVWLVDGYVVREQYLLLQVQLEEGEIDEDEYSEREAELMARLREIKARKRAEVEDDEVPAGANVQARRRVVIETPFDDDE